MEKRFEYIKNPEENMLVKCYCLDEKKIVVENGVQVIGPSVFRGSSAEEIVLPDSVEEIYDKAFAYCPNLKHITVGGNNLRKISKQVFNGCVNLQEISFVSTLEEEMRSVFSDLANSFIKSHACYGLTASEIMDNIEEAFSKKCRKMTLKVSAGEKSIVIPRDVDMSGRRLLTKIAFNSLLDDSDKTAAEEYIPFDDSQNWDEFFALHISNVKCSFLTAMELYLFERNKGALHYLKTHSSSICLMLAAEKNDSLLTEFVKLNIMDERKLNYALQKAIDNGLAVSTAYILNLLDKKKEESFQI